MELNEKIKQLMKENYLSVADLVRRSEELFIKSPFKYQTLKQIVDGKVSPRYKTILKIATLLEVRPIELIRNTDWIDNLIITDENAFQSFNYPSGAKLVHKTPPTCSFSSAILTLAPNQKTLPEQCPVTSDKNFEINVIVVSGRLKLHIEDQVINLKLRDSYTFDGKKLHYFENQHKDTCRCVVVINPKHH